MHNFIYVTSQGHGLCVHVWSIFSESRMDYTQYRVDQDRGVRRGGAGVEEEEGQEE